MELRDYFAVLHRRWRVIAGVVALTLVIAVPFSLRGPRSFEATQRLAVSVASAAPVGDQPPYAYYREYYLWLASEYLADDLSEIIQSDAFAADLGAYLKEDLDLQAVRDVIRVRKTHRILDVTVQAPQADRAMRMAGAIAEVIRTKGPTYVAQLSTPTAHVVPIDQPRVKPATTTGSLALDLALRALLATLVGIFVAFVVDYLDSTLRSPSAVERALGLRVLGEIPVEGRS